MRERCGMQFGRVDSEEVVVATGRRGSRGLSLPLTTTDVGLVYSHNRLYLIYTHHEVRQMENVHSQT